MVKRYQQKPVYIEAIRYTNGNEQEIIDFIESKECKVIRVVHRQNDYSTIYVDDPFSSGLKLTTGQWLTWHPVRLFVVYSDGNFVKMFEETP